MNRLIKRRPSPAMIIAVLALVAALGGTAVAGGFLTTKKAKKQFLTTKKFKKQAVRGPVHYVTATVTVPRAPSGGESVQAGSATCPAGTKVIGGGVKIVTNAFTSPIDSYPTATGWTGTAFQANDLFDGTFVVTAICATVKQTSGAPLTS